MALGTPTAGAVAYSAADGTTVSPAYPASIASGDCLVLIVGQKPNTANGGTLTDPSGWTRRQFHAGGGYGNTLTDDQGNTNLYFLTKDTVAGTESGNLSVTVGDNEVCWAQIIRIPSGVGNFSYATATGTRDTTPTTPLQVTMGSDPGFTSGDMAIFAMCVPTDAINNTFDAWGITQTGATFATGAELGEPDSATGLDIGGVTARAACTSGPSTAAPRLDFTIAGGTLTHVRGPLIVLRVRENLAPVTGSLSVTETGTDTFSGSGDVIVSGSLSATETGADTFSASGTVTDPSITGSMAATEAGDDTLSGSGKVIVTGSLSATETGADTFSGTGNVLISGSMSATETESDAFSGSGKVLVSGSLSATEEGNDTFSGSGFLEVQSITGSMAATEVGNDTASASGKVLVSGSLSATEVGADVCLADGTVLVSGSLVVTEVGDDVFAGLGELGAQGVIGSMAATESGNDQLGGYVLDNYVSSGYVQTGIFGTVTGGQAEKPKAGGSVSVGSKAALKGTAIRMLNMMGEVEQTATVKRITKKLEDVLEQERPRPATVETLATQAIQELQRQEKFADYMIEIRAIRSMINDLKAIKERLEEDDEEALLLLS